MITPFSGDPDVSLSINAVIAYLKVGQRSGTFVKSKLADQALKFYISLTTCKNAFSSADLFNILKKHFKAESANSIALQYNIIKFNSSESFFSFC